MTDPLDEARETIKHLVGIAMRQAALIGAEGSTVHTDEANARRALSYFSGANGILMAHGPLYSEFIEADDFIELRRLQRLFP